MTRGTVTRTEAVAEFLLSDPKYLRLGFEVELAVRHLRASMVDGVRETLGDFATREGNRPGWSLKRADNGWALKPTKRGWRSDTWDGVWVWPDKNNSPDFLVGVAGWPDQSAEEKLVAFLDAAAKCIESSNMRGAWSRPQHDVAKRQVQWVFGGQDLLLGGDPKKGAEEIMGLAKALMKVAKP